MLVERHFSRIDTLELKSQIVKKLGRLKAEKYFDLLTKFLSLKLSKSEFDRLCVSTIGRENVGLHNHLLRSIIKSTHFSKTLPPKESKVEGALSVKVPNGYQRSNLQSLCGDFPRSPCKVRTNLSDRRIRDCPSPLGPHGKSHSVIFEDSVPKIQEQSATELRSLGSRPLGSVEDGDEVDQAAGSPGIHSRSPVRAPLGIPINAKGAWKVPFNPLASTYHSEICLNNGELPDTSSLRKKLLQMLQKEGLNVSVDCANLLNKSLDIYLKKLIKPCLDLATSRTGQKHVGQQNRHYTHGLNEMRPVTYVQKPGRFLSASILDFRVAMELNPSILGEEWPMQIEKVCLRGSEE